MTSFVFFLIALFQATAAGPPGDVRATLRQLRDHLDEHKPTFGATAELTAAKHQVRDWVEGRLSSMDQNVDARALGAVLHTTLDEARLLCTDLHEECDWNFLGYLDDVRISRSGDFLIVITAVGIWCGFDESAYVYAFDGGRWRRRWEHEQTTYTPEAFKPQSFQDVQVSAPDASGARLILTLGAQTICGGAFKDLYVRAWRMDANGSRQVFEWTGHANDAYARARVLPDEVRFQFSAGGLLSGEVHTAVRRFTIDQGKAVQADPVAGLPRDFVVEWLSAPWEESRTRSETPALQSRHALLHRSDGVGDFPGATTRCSGGSELWQVVTNLYERPKTYYRVRWQSRYRFTMVDISDTPYPDCTTDDSRGDTYTDVLASELP